MTYVMILPKNEHAQSRMTEDCDAAMDLLFLAVKEILQIPDSDIILELTRCTTVAFNRSAVDAAVAPDVVLTFATSDRDLPPRFDTLCDRVLSDWNDRFGDLKLEVWVSLIDAWAANTEA